MSRRRGGRQLGPQKEENLIHLERLFKRRSLFYFIGKWSKKGASWVRSCPPASPAENADSTTHAHGTSPGGVKGLKHSPGTFV